jgi:hypothetical protein
MRERMSSSGFWDRPAPMLSAEYPVCSLRDLPYSSSSTVSTAHFPTLLIFTRRGNDWSRRFRKIAHDAFLISAASAIIDREVIVPAADGTADFSVLQNELKGKSEKITMVAFDLL